MIRRSTPFHPANLLLLAPAVLCTLIFHTIFQKIDFLWLEALLLILILSAVVIAGKRLTWSARPPAWCGILRRASRSTPLACLLPAVASIFLRMILLPWMPIPPLSFRTNSVTFCWQKPFYLADSPLPPIPSGNISSPYTSSPSLPTAPCIWLARLASWRPANYLLGICSGESSFQQPCSVER